MKTKLRPLLTFLIVVAAPAWLGCGAGALTGLGDLDNLLAATVQNESTGGSGAAIDSGTTSPFLLFQNLWTDSASDRGGAISADGINNVYSLGAYIDPNDGFATKIFVVDRTNNRILIFNNIPTSNSNSPDVVVGQSDFTSGTANAGGTTSASGFNSPVHVTVCANGRMFVSDSSNHRVLGYNQIPQSNGVAADFVLGQPNFAGNTSNNGVGGSATQDIRYNRPYAVHCLFGKLLVLDRNNQRILIYNDIPTTAQPATADPVPDVVIGQPDLSTVGSGSCDYSSGTSYLSNPYEIGSFNGRFFVADGGNHRVLVFNTIPTSSNAKPNYVIGQPNTSSCAINAGAGNDVPSANTFHFPNCLAFKDNKMAVCDHSNQRLLFFNLPISANNPDADYVLGRPDFTTGAPSPPATAEGTYGNIKGLIFDNGFIWVGDSGNNRVQINALPY